MSLPYRSSLGNMCPSGQRKGQSEIDSGNSWTPPTLGAHIRERIVGQRQAIDSVVSAIRRRKNGWCSDNHPLVCLFLGSSGKPSIK